ncbi:hypothetical protein Tco_1232902 [Tanacetum coccineum]
MVNVRHNEVLKSLTSKEVELSASDAEHDINDDVSSSSSEDPNFGGFTEEDSKAPRSMINKQVVKAIKNVMPYYISQTTDNLKEIIQKELGEFKKERTTNDYRNEMASYRDFTACDVPKFDGALDLIVSTRWLAAIEGKVCEKGKEWIGSCTWKEFKELFNAKYTLAEDIGSELGRSFNSYTKLMIREVDLLRKENKEVKETKRKNEFRERDAKKPRHDQGRRSGGTQFKTPSKPLKSAKEEKVEKTEVPKPKARVYMMTAEEDKVVHDVVTGREIIIYGDRKKDDFKLGSVMKDRRYLSRGFHAFMTHVMDTSFENKDVEDVPIVNKFLDVFLKDLPGILPERQVEFRIDLVPGATPIAKTPYRLAPSEMKELLSQLQELLDKGFIRPSLKLDPAKVEAVMNWHDPKNVGEIQSFLGLTGYYRRFIQDFSKIASSLMKLTKKNTPFEWGRKQEEAFITL